MNSDVSLDIFTFKQVLSIVLALLATLCAIKIYFEDSKIYHKFIHNYFDNWYIKHNHGIC